MYQNLVSSGELKILENREITDILLELEETYLYMNRMENIHLQIILDHFSKEIKNAMDLSLGKAEQPELLNSFHFDYFLILEKILLRCIELPFCDARGTLGALHIQPDPPGLDGIEFLNQAMPIGLC